MMEWIEAICQVKFAVKGIRSRITLVANFMTLKRDLIEYLFPIITSWIYFGFLFRKNIKAVKAVVFTIFVFLILYIWFIHNWFVSTTSLELIRVSILNRYLLNSFQNFREQTVYADENALAISASYNINIFHNNEKLTR